MILNRIMALILHYFTELVASGAHCVKVVKNIAKLAVTQSVYFLAMYRLW